jgi:hypothetical protein
MKLFLKIEKTCEIISRKIFQFQILAFTGIRCLVFIIKLKVFYFFSNNEILEKM